MAWYPAITLAYKTSMELAKETGLTAVSIINTGHTGRHGAFADDADAEGFLSICRGTSICKKFEL